MVNREPAASEFGRGIEALLDSPYARYLDLQPVFDIQISRRDGLTLRHPDEVLFRSVHLSSELWLRLAGYELDRAMDLLRHGSVVHATRLIGRADESVWRVIENTAVLESLAPADYHQFRIFFGEASGLQSPGYAYVRLQCRSMSDVFDAFIDDDALLELFLAPNDDLRYDLCQAMLNLDASLDRFRALHLQIAQRFLGETTAGTGGQGVDYLRRNMGRQHFPRLWAVGDRVAQSAGAVPYGAAMGSSDD